MNTRTMLLACVLSALIAGLTACAPARPTEPTAIVQALYDHINRGDMDGFMTYFSDDAVMVDDAGRFVGAQAIREHVQMDAVAGGLRFEVSNLKAEGNVATYTYKAYVGDAVVDTHDCVDVIANGLIIFDGTSDLYEYECTRDPTQVFCPGS